MTKEKFKQRMQELCASWDRTEATIWDDGVVAAEEAGVVWDEPGAQGPGPKRLTVRQLEVLAWCSESERPEQWKGALRTAMALGYEVVPDEVELPAVLEVAGIAEGRAIVGNGDAEPWIYLTTEQARAVAAWWGQRSEVEAAKEEAGPGNAATRLRRALAAPARAARGEG